MAKVNWKDSVCGLKMIEVRNLLRNLRDDEHITPKTILHELKLMKKSVPKGITLSSFVGELVEMGFLELHGDQDGSFYWLASRGMSLAAAKATARITLAVAGKELADLLDRVKYVNADDDMAFRVKKVVLFGSVKEAILDRIAHDDFGDVDVLITYENKNNNDRAEFFRKCSIVWDKYRDFVRPVDHGSKAMFALRLVEFRVKGQRKAISIHGEDDAEIAKNGAVVFDYYAVEAC